MTTISVTAQEMNIGSFLAGYPSVFTLSNGVQISTKYKGVGVRIGLSLSIVAGGLMIHTSTIKIGWFPVPVIGAVIQKVGKLLQEKAPKLRIQSSGADIHISIPGRAIASVSATGGTLSITL